MSPSIGEQSGQMRISSQEAKEERDEGIGRELDYYATFAQNADFRQFVRKLSRCRSIASLDVENATKNSNSNEDIIEDEKGKLKKCNVNNNNTTSTNNRTNSSDDNIKLNDYKSQTRTRKQAINTWSAEEDPTGRGDSNNHIRKTQRPYSDIYGEFPNQLQKSTSTSNIDSNCDFSKPLESSGNYSSMSLPRRNKRASVLLKERHQSMMMIQEGQELGRGGVFTLPRVSCYHRSTR